MSELEFTAIQMRSNQPIQKSFIPFSMFTFNFISLSTQSDADLLKYYHEIMKMSKNFINFWPKRKLFLNG